MAWKRGRGGRKPGWSTQANEIVSRVFVYGTFRAGESARAMIAGHVAATTPATISGKMYVFPEGYPGMIEDPDSTVIGEVLDLQDLTAALALLDAFEGDDYERTLRQATLHDDTLVWVWCYMLSDFSSVRGAVHIAEGDWVDWRMSHSV